MTWIEQQNTMVPLFSLVRTRTNKTNCEQWEQPVRQSPLSNGALGGEWAFQLRHQLATCQGYGHGVKGKGENVELDIVHEAKRN